MEAFPFIQPMEDVPLEFISMIKLLLPAHLIPLGTTVLKRGGSKPYVLINEIIIYSNVEGVPKQTISANDSSLFLRDQQGNATIISKDTELAWELTIEELHEWAEEQLEEDK